MPDLTLKYQPLDSLEVTSEYNDKRWYTKDKSGNDVTRPHLGLDLRARTPIDLYNAHDGEVIFSDYSNTYGKVVIIQDSITGQIKEETYRFVTNIIDPDLLPAEDFIKLYMGRWEIENSFKELKVIVPNYGSMIRAKIPELVYQEIYALLLVHYVTRSLMHESALKEDIDVDELSFVHSFSIIKRKARNYPIFSPEEKKKS